MPIVLTSLADVSGLQGVVPFVKGRVRVHGGAYFIILSTSVGIDPILNTVWITSTYVGVQELWKRMTVNKDARVSVWKFPALNTMDRRAIPKNKNKNQNYFKVPESDDLVIVGAVILTCRRQLIGKDKISRFHKIKANIKCLFYHNTNKIVLQ